RAGRTARRVVGPEHEVVDEELRAPSEQIRQRGAPLVGLEAILLVDPDPWQLLPPPRQLVALPRQLLLRLEQLEPRCEPLCTRPGLVLRHRCSLLSLLIAVVGDLRRSTHFQDPAGARARDAQYSTDRLNNKQPVPRTRSRRLDRVYGAIASPTRRAILTMLARGEVNVGDLAARFPVSFN